jgi:hypothetical protein
VDCDDVAVLDSQVVTHDSVDAGAAIVKVIVGQDDQDGVLSLLASHEHCVTSEQLQLLHGVVGQGDDRVVIVGSIRDPVVGRCEVSSCGMAGRGGKLVSARHRGADLHQLVGLLLLLEDGG